MPRIVVTVSALVLAAASLSLGGTSAHASGGPVTPPAVEEGRGEPAPFDSSAEDLERSTESSDGTAGPAAEALSAPTRTGEPTPVTTQGAPEVPATSRRAIQAGRPVVIDDGHVDMGPRIVDGAWRVQLKDDTASPVVWRDLSDVVLHARDASRVQVSGGDGLSFLGTPGSTAYVLPQVQRSGLVWPGWNTQDPSVLELVPGPVAWRLTGVDGPGRFVLYLTGSFGDVDVLFDTARGLPQQIDIARNTHVHGNWAFTEPGTYHLTVQMSATSGDGTSLSDSRTLTIVVGDDTSSPGPGGSSTGGSPSPGSGVSIAASGPESGSGSGGSIPATGLAGSAPKLAVAVGLIVGGAALSALGGRRRLPTSTQHNTERGNR